MKKLVRNIVGRTAGVEKQEEISSMCSLATCG